MRTLTGRELNRTLLLRQFLLARTRRPLLDVIARLVALQAQYAPSPYVALWSRRAGFRKTQLTEALRDGSAVKSGVIRGTLHVVTRDLYPFIESAHIESQRGRVAGLGVDPAALFDAWPDGPVDDATALAGRLLGTEDPWTIAFTLRALPWVRTEPVGDWPHTKPSPSVPWREPLAPPGDGAARVVRDYLAGYGPAAREDIEQFTGFRVRQIAPVLDGLRTYADERGRTLFDVPGARLAPAAAPAPVRFLPPFDSIVLAHRDRSRILPNEYRDVVLRRRNATTLATFTVDGLIAGSWKAERVRGQWRIAGEQFAPLPGPARRDVAAERDALERFYNG
ncbi:MAG TPA: winged helix DNA-binding domain-containing protein [Gaiellaceae bacterium]|nr:winged helix DNA-binding domain-containing protein [Gaiellaceae bacterium]